MLTPKEEHDYYIGQYKTSLALGRRDPDYLIVAERFKSTAELWKKKTKMVMISTPSGSIEDDPLYLQFNKAQKK